MDGEQLYWASLVPLGVYISFITIIIIISIIKYYFVSITKLLLPQTKRLFFLFFPPSPLEGGV